MDTAPAAALESSSGRGRRVVLWLVVVLPVLLAFAPRDLWAPEEPRFGRSAHEMAVDGDWWVTHLNGKVDAEKPPLLFWMMAAVEKVVGRPTPVGMRIPGALLASLAVLATARLARRWFADRALAEAAAIMFGTTALVIWNGPRVGMDMALAAFAVIALEGATAAIRDGEWWGAVRLGVGIGLGLLAKGPHVLYLPLCGAIGGAFAMRRRTSADGGLLRPPGAALRVGAGVLIGLAIFAAWLVPALLLRGGEATYDGDTYAHRLVGQLSRRVAGENEPHQAGPFALIPLLLLFGLPWTPFVAAGARMAMRPRSAPAADRFGLGAAIAGVLLPLLLLSIPASKRETYLVPLLPCASILAAYAVHRAPRDGWMKASVRFTVGGLAALAVGVVLIPIIVPRAWTPDRFDAVSGADFASTLLPVAWILGAITPTIVTIVRRRPSVEWIVRSVACSLALAAGGVFFGLLPIIDPAKSLIDAAAVARREAPNATLQVAATSDPSALWWDFGADRLGPRIDDYATLARTLAPTAPRALVLAKGPFWRDRAKLGKPEEAVAMAALDRVRVLWERRVNGYTWHLLTNESK